MPRTRRAPSRGALGSLLLALAGAALLAAPGPARAQAVCSLAADAVGGGSVRVEGGGAVDPELEAEIASDRSFVRLENSEIRLVYRPYFADFAQFAIREARIKTAGNAEQVCCGTHHYMDADAGRGVLVDAQLVYDGGDRKTVRLEWLSHTGGTPRIVHEVSIFPNSRALRIDYLDVYRGLNLLDLGRPGGTTGGVHVSHGHEAWGRPYVTHTLGEYYDRYPPDGVNDPADGGALAYEGHFVIGVYNPANGQGWGRVNRVEDVSIYKLLLSDSARRGLELFPYPFYRQHAPFTGWLYFVTGGEDEILSVGRALADGAGGAPQLGCGDTAALTATAYTGWSFDRWTGDLSGSANPETLVLSGAHAVDAVFAPAAGSRFEGFEGLAPGADPSAWLDTAAGNSLVEDDSLFAVAEAGGERFLSTSSTETNIHSHWLAPGSDSESDYTFTGRMRITEPDGGVGVTFLSQYPDRHAYYRLRRYGSNAFHLAPVGTELDGGTLDTGVVPTPGTWYRFAIEVADTGARTEIRARVWPDGAPEPSGWQVDAFDEGSDRLVAGPVGVWSFDDGRKDWDELAVALAAGAPCANGADDDGDGLVDLADPGCGGDPGWPEEDPECSDGLDNDGDGKVDWDGAGQGAADSHCAGPETRRESGFCGLGFELAPGLAALAWARKRRRRGTK